MNYVYLPDTNIIKDFENIQEVSALMLENRFETGTKIVVSGTLHACGIASKYADTSKIPLEKNAWAEAAVEKYSHKSGDK